MKSIALSFALLTLCACDATLSDVVLNVWETDAFLDDASSARLLVSEGDLTEVRELNEGVALEGFSAAASEGKVELTIETQGSRLANAVGRSGLLELNQEDETIVASLVLAEAGTLVELSEVPSDARRDIAACQSADGRVHIISGISGEVISRSNFVLDFNARMPVSGPELNVGRRSASCTDDGKGGILLFGGCDEADLPLGGLFRSLDGTLDAPFESIEALPDAGCGVGSVTVVGSGVTFLNFGDRIQTFENDEVFSPSFTLPNERFFAQMVPFDFENGVSRILVAGGKRANGELVEDAFTLVFDGSNFFTGPSMNGRLAVRWQNGVALFDGDQVLNIGANDQSEVILSGLREDLGQNFGPTQMAALPNNTFAFLSQSGSQIAILNDEGLQSVSLSPPRAGAYLFTDRGGALVVVGGGVAGVQVLVLP